MGPGPAGGSSGAAAISAAEDEASTHGLLLSRRPGGLGGSDVASSAVPSLTPEAEAEHARLRHLSDFPPPLVPGGIELDFSQP
jgi:hypothetical protein